MVHLEQENKNDESETFMYALNDGNKIPALGFGTYLLKNNKCVKVVQQAINAGYRHIDTAIFYENEQFVGEAIKKSKIKRKDLFITSKLWSDDHEKGGGETEKAVLSSIKKLGVDYIDLYLIHSPYGDHNVATFKELLKLKKEGKLKSVGVSNYGIQHLKALEKAGCPLPAVNERFVQYTSIWIQIELHPWLQQREIVKYCKSKNILIESYSPLTKGQKLKKNNNTLNGMAKKYNKTVAQILLKWNVQKGYVVLAKSQNEERIRQNFDTLNWKLTKEDMANLVNR